MEAAVKDSKDKVVHRAVQESGGLVIAEGRYTLMEKYTIRDRIRMFSPRVCPRQ
jgi:hypothetical protein